MTFDRGDLVWIDFNPQKGREQAGRRPALVLSPKDYNALSRCIIVCPITSNMSPWPWKVPLPPDAGISGAVLVDQIKSIDGAVRHIEPAHYRLGDDVIADMLARLAALLGQPAQ